MFNRTDDTYYIKEGTITSILSDKANPLNEISSIIPDGSKVLDIGSGNGLFSRILLSKKNNILIDGIEPNKFAGTIAKTNYHKFYEGFLEDHFDQIDFFNYDYFVIADVIEHIKDPDKFLEKLTSTMGIKAKIILSVPNIAFGSIRYSLLKGDFDYVDSGILEKTHLRFFTYRTLLNLFSNLQLNVDKIIYLQRNFLKTEIPVKPKNIFDWLVITHISHDPLAHVYQFVFVLSKQHIQTELSKRGKNLNELIIDKLKRMFY
jgi:2-polyprenyl-3-methyl-5-hydroxy-6-metoxy-1,4-benzoquinol methylase